MHKSRKIIRVRYRNSNGTLSRPQKLQQITYDDNSIEYHTMNMSSRKPKTKNPLKVGFIEHKTKDNKGNTKVHYSIDPNSFVLTWEKPSSYTNPIRQNLPQYQEDLVRVKFIKKTIIPAVLDKEGNEVKPEIEIIKYGRPRKVYKLTLLTSYSVKVGDEHVEKQKENSVIYTPFIKNSRKVLDPTEFITNWEAGPTPTPKRKKYTGESDERFYNSKDINIVFKALKITKKLKDVINVARELEISTRQRVRDLLDSGELDIVECRKQIQIHNESLKATHRERNSCKAVKKLKGFNTKTGTTTIQIMNSKGIILTKHFPSKGLLNNDAYHGFIKQADGKYGVLNVIYTPKLTTCQKKFYKKNQAFPSVKYMKERLRWVQKEIERKYLAKIANVNIEEELP